MHWSDIAWLGIGFAAQGFFSARFLLQWLLSERARRSLMPIHFWYFSVAGAVLLLAYAVHRRDPVIVTGQIIGLAIFLRNIEFIGRERFAGKTLSWMWPWVGLTLVAVYCGYHFRPDFAARQLVLHDFWTVWGFAAQAVFTGRFLLQWIYAERMQRSVTPLGFWYMSIVGSVMLLAYAIAVIDPVIILGQAFGVLVYSRNLILIRRSFNVGESPSS